MIETEKFESTTPIQKTPKDKIQYVGNTNIGLGHLALRIPQNQQEKCNKNWWEW